MCASAGLCVCVCVRVCVRVFVYFVCVCVDARALYESVCAYVRYVNNLCVYAVKISVCVCVCVCA